MNGSASAAIETLYALTGTAFDQRLHTILTNVKRQLLEDFVGAPSAIHEDVEELLGDVSAAIIEVQKTGCRDANITADQKQDFENRLDSEVADAIIIIRDSFATFRDRASVDFQLETARQLGIPVA